MAKCTQCGKKGLLLKLNNESICKDCETEIRHKAVVDELNNKIKSLQFQLLPEQQDITKLRAEIDELTQKLNAIIERKRITVNELNNLNGIIKEKKKEIIELDDEILFQSFGVYTPLYNFAKSENYKDKLTAVRDAQKLMIKNESACSFNSNWTLNGSLAQGKRMTKNVVKQILRCFNSECDEVIDKVKFSNMQSMRDRINKSYEQLNKINDLQQVRINPRYRDLKLDELSLAYEYALKVQEEKEALKEQKRQLREQAKLEAEIREAREKIEKDRKHFQKAINDIEYKLKFSKNEEETADLQAKLSELNSQVGELEAEEKKIDYREQNAKAGYVYIISNIGAFGENIYKIGMTRRLEPMDRIDELSSASVPFPFDVHTLIFSNNAPELESKLHKRFEDKRVNRINGRKEFYKVSIEEIEEVLKQEYDKTIEIIKMPEADEYRQSVNMEKPISKIDELVSFFDEDDKTEEANI